MLSISNTTRRKVNIPKLFFSTKSSKILGKDYDISLVFIGNKRSKTLNSRYRGKNYPTNVLSFPLDEESGEIFINLDLIKSGAKGFEISEKKYIVYLFIHSCLHLKGYEHGTEMDTLEQKYLKDL